MILRGVREPATALRGKAEHGIRRRVDGEDRSARIELENGHGRVRDEGSVPFLARSELGLGALSGGARVPVLYSRNH